MTEEEKPSERFVVREVATETQPVIMDTETEETLTLYSAVAGLKNDVLKMMKILK